MASTTTDDGRLDRPVGLRFIGDTGLANLSRICGWLAHGLNDRTPGGAYSTIRTGDAGVGNLHALGRGEVDVAVVTPSAAAALAVRGVGPFAAQGYPHLRAIGEVPHPDRLVFAVGADLGISSFAELRERRTPLRLATALDAPGGMFAGYAAERVLAAAGLSPETLREWGGEVIAHDAPFVCLAAVAEGRADAVLHEAVMMPWWSDAAEQRALTYLPFEPEVLRAVEAELSCPPVEMPSGSLPGLDEPLQTIEFRGFLVVAREDLASDVAYLLSHILGETSGPFVAMNYGHIPVEQSPISYPIQRAALAQTPIALHPGSARYYEQAAARAQS
jgi:TRAP-type uncharacterized transport system substrate-binding protein